MIKKNFNLVLISFFLGSIITFFMADFLTSKPVDTEGSKIFKSARQHPFVQVGDIHNQIRSQMKKMMQNSFVGFDDVDFENMKRNSIKIDEREDDQHKYIEIDAKGINKEAIKIELKNGMIEVFGEIKKITKSNNSGMRSSSTSISTFQRTMNIPFGVIEKRMKVRMEGNKIILKFPKVKK